MTSSDVSGTNLVHLILHEEQAVYSIGEPVRPQLQILNDTAQRRELGRGFRFDWETLAFAEPNFVHLTGPDGDELALPYRRDKSYFDFAESISVEPGQSEWLYLPIYAHFHLRALGTYTFWLELMDDLNTLQRSNTLSFQLIDVEMSVPPERGELALQVHRASFAPADPIEVEVNITNRFDRPLIFLRPQQDSFYGWANPVYQFTVIDNAGRSLALARRSGTMAMPMYDEITQFTVAPGASVQQPLQLPIFPQLSIPGVYRVRLTYLVRKQAIGKAGVVLDTPMNWSDGVFIGRLESNEVLITVS